MVVAIGTGAPYGGSIGNIEFGFDIDNATECFCKSGRVISVPVAVEFISDTD